MRFLLDTNILIPLENSQVVLEESLAHFVRLANENGHQLVYHPASEDDISRDTDLVRRGQTVERLKQYIRLQDRLVCPWNVAITNPNDRADNEILYALKCESAHALLTEDRGIHDKAKRHGLIGRVYTIQTARDWLRRLHEKTSVRLPNIEDRELSFLVPFLDSDFFNSLRQAYDFDNWFRAKAREGKRAWVAWEAPGRIGALCVYAQQTNEKITEEGIILSGAALKLCTFKVAESIRGQKIGELFLKAAFRYATANRLENIFIHGVEDQHHLLFELLEDFGFSRVGSHPGSNGRDAVYVKNHPVQPPSLTTLDPFEYSKSFFPHFRHDAAISKFIVPIAKQLNLTHYTASAMIKALDSSAVKQHTKSVNSVPKNQDLLIQAVTQFLSSTTDRLILDGHFAVPNMVGKFEIVSADIFKQLKLDAVAVCFDDASQIHARRMERDKNSIAINKIEAVQQIELEHGKSVAASLGIPFFKIKAFDAESLLNAFCQVWELNPNS